jgi:hypothetical protein
MERPEKLCFRYSGFCYQGSTEKWEPLNRSFNDLAFYKNLWNEDGCVSVKIASVRVRHNNYCHGIQAIYEVAFADGTTARHPGPANFSSSGYYSYGSKDSWIHLEDDEYIQGLKIRQGHIVDRITVVTNHREVHFGGNGGGPVMMMPEIPSSVRVVAFAGLYHGVCCRIAFYATPLAWERIGVYIILRKLVNQGRAVAEVTNAGPNEITAGMIVHQVISLDEGPFRNIMEFMTPTKVRWSNNH